MGKMWRLNWGDMSESGTEQFALYVALTVKLRERKAKTKVSAGAEILVLDEWC